MGIDYVDWCVQHDSPMHSSDPEWLWCWGWWHSSESGPFVDCVLGRVSVEKNRDGSVRVTRRALEETDNA